MLKKHMKQLDLQILCVHQDTVKKYLSPDQNKLYNLIWSRALSSQMKPAQFDRNTITITSDDNGTVCKASGSVIKFEGFLKSYERHQKR